MSEHGIDSNAFMHDVLADGLARDMLTPEERALMDEFNERSDFYVRQLMDERGTELTPDLLLDANNLASADIPGGEAAQKKWDRVFEGISEGGQG